MLQAGQAHQGHPDSRGRLAEKDGRVCRGCEDFLVPKVKRGTLVLVSQEKMVSPAPQGLRVLQVMARWVPLDPWASKAFLASLAPQAPQASQGRLATVTPLTASGPCRWSSSIHP